MTIESTSTTATYRYQINADDARCLDRKENKHNARWVKCYVRYATAEIAKANLLRLSGKDGDK